MPTYGSQLTAAALTLLALVAYTAAVTPNATATNASDFHLWLKCKAIELYVNVTGVNFTLPRCDAALLNTTFIVGRAGVKPLPMIGVGELKKLNATDPKAVFEQLKAIRLTAVRELGRHLNKTLERVYIQLNSSGDAFGVLNSTEKSLGVLTRVRSMLMLVNASGYAAYLNRHLEDLMLIREALRMSLNMSKWVVGNMSDRELDDKIAEVERLRDRLRELMDRFEAMKLTALRGVLTPRVAFLNNTAAVLRELRALDPAARIEVLRSVGRGVDIREALRQIREKTPTGRAPEDAGRGAGQGRGR